MVPENIRTEQQLQEYRRQRPKEDDGKVCPFCCAEEKKIGKSKPEESKDTGRQVYNRFMSGKIPFR